MMNLNNIEILIGLWFFFIFLIYFLYNRRVNSLIIRNVTLIIFFLLLSLIFLIIIKDYPIKDYLGYIGGLIAFGLSFIQYSINKEQEIISLYNQQRKKIDGIETFIQNYKMLVDIIKHSNNFETILMNEIYEVINSESFDKFKGGIKDKLLKINTKIGNNEYFIEILGKMIKRNKYLIKFLKRDEDIKKVQIDIERINYIKNIFENSHETIFKNPTIFDKIKTFFTP